MKASWDRVKRDGYLPISTAYTNVVNQRLALPVTYIAWKLGVTPNLLTSASALLTVFALLIITLGAQFGLWCSVTAYLSLFIGYVLDSSDGQLARVTQRSSRFGGVFDHFVDGAKILALNLCFGWVLAKHAEVELGYLAMALNTFAQCMLFFGSKLKISSYGAKLSEKLGTPKLRVRIFSIPFDFLDWGVFISIVWLLQWPRIFLYTYVLYGCFAMMTFLMYSAYSAVQMLRADAREHSNMASD